MKILLLIPVIIGILLVSNHAYASNGRYIVLTFDDNPLGQYTFAKPILDTYGYKGNFMVVCNWVGLTNRMSWTQISALANDGMAIGSHTMTHGDLNIMSASQLQFELGQSKICLQSHGFNPTTFSYPRNFGSENATVVKVVAQYYNTAKSLGNQGPQPFLFLSCDAGFAAIQVDCSTYKSGNLQYENQYGIRMRSIDDIEQHFNFNDTLAYNFFIQWIENQTSYNVNGQIVALPVVTFHNLIAPTDQSYWLHTNQLVFAKIAKFLNNTKYTVLTMDQIGYNPNTNTMYIKGLMNPTQTKGSILTLNAIPNVPRGTPISVSGMLTTTAGIPISNELITFTGNGAKNISPTKTKTDGTFVQTGISPNYVSKFQVNAIYTGNQTLTSSVAIQKYNTK
jgi:hypothetical protein